MNELVGSFFLIGTLLVLVGLYITRPLLDKKPVRNGGLSQHEQQEISSLLAERDRVLNALQELDFDNALGKIPPEDYPVQRQMILTHGAVVLRKLDEFYAEAGGTQAGSAEDRLEAVIASRRLAGGAVAAADAGAATFNGAGIEEAGDEIEVLIASRRRARQGKSAGFCPQCGTALQKSDKFCPKCGMKLAV